MRKLNSKIYVLFVLTAFILGIYEYQLSIKPTVYAIKYADLTRVAPKVEIVITGNSFACVGINPDLFDKAGYNLANQEQSIYYDSEILKERLSQMPKLKMAIITFSYVSFGTELEDIDQWRTFFYDQYFGIPPSSNRNAANYNFTYWIDPRRFSKVAIFTEKTLRSKQNDFIENNLDRLQSNGWFYEGLDVMSIDSQIIQKKAEDNNLMVRESQFFQNLTYVESLAEELKKHNVIPILIQFPLQSSYVEYLDRRKFQAMDSAISEFALKYTLQYFNYTYDERFNSNDFTNDLPSHLNSKGASKFSEILNNEIIGPAFSYRDSVNLVAQQTHNLEVGLPIDFDPELYLELNPGLIEFWHSRGINKSGQDLLNHAELHYKNFGIKDNWKYKRFNVNDLFAPGFWKAKYNNGDTGIFYGIEDKIIVLNNKLGKIKRKEYEGWNGKILDNNHISWIVNDGSNIKGIWTRQ